MIDRETELRYKLKTAWLSLIESIFWLVVLIYFTVWVINSVTLNIKIIDTPQQQEGEK